MQALSTGLLELGVRLHEDSIALNAGPDATEWSFLVSAQNRRDLINVVDLSREIMKIDRLETLSIQPARN